MTAMLGLLVLQGARPASACVPIGWYYMYPYTPSLRGYVVDHFGYATANLCNTWGETYGQRKVCGFWGCDWEKKGTASPQVYVSDHRWLMYGYQGCVSGTHRYRTEVRLWILDYNGDWHNVTADSQTQPLFTC